MSLSGVTRIKHGVRLVEEMHKQALLKDPQAAHDLLAEVCRILFRDRPDDLTPAVARLNEVQREVNRKARASHLPRTLPLEPHKWMTIYSTRPVASRDGR